MSVGEAMTGLKRTHYCCDVDENMIGKNVVVMGWVNKRRDLGQLIFIALRDRTGLLQITVDGNKTTSSASAFPMVPREYASSTVPLRRSEHQFT